MPKLYKFTKLSSFLNKNNFPKANASQESLVITAVDFKQAYSAKQISFDSDGIYYTVNGTKVKGFMFLGEYSTAEYGGKPKIHTQKCDTIQRFLSKGTFKARYLWSNSRVVTYRDRDIPSKEYKDCRLSICGHCKKMEGYSTIKTSEQFFKKFTKDLKITKPKSEKTDIFGYSFGWEKISKRYREKHNYTCEQCKVSVEDRFDRKYIHVHHVDNNKQNNNSSNLKCLCIDCHSKVDKYHKKNFGSGFRARELMAFRKKYKS